jgi:hypothetical protein
LALLLAGLGCLLAAGPARAGILFSNLGPGDTYDTSVGYTIGLGFTQGDAFTPSATANLSDIGMALNFAFGDSHDVTVQLRADAGGQPGAVIETYSATTTGQFGSQNPLVFVDSTSHPLLLAGTQYWVIASSDSGSDNPWNLNSTGDSGPHALSTDGGTTFSVVTKTRGAFLVEGTAVPEPASLTLLGLGAIALAGYRLRRQKATA